MKCQKCGYEISDANKPCLKCGFKAVKHKEVDQLIMSMIEEDDYEPKFKPKNQNGTTSKSKTKKTTTKNTTTSTKSKGDVLILITKYMILLSIMIFVATMFFSWFQLSGSAVNLGVIRNAETEVMMNQPLREIIVDGSDDYDGAIITFTGYNLFTFAKATMNDYGTVTSRTDEVKLSLVSKANGYYMLGILVMIALCVIAAIVLIGFKRYKGLPMVRNVALLNIIILSLNYMALRIPYFSMIAVKAKDFLGQSMVHPSLKLSMSGISMNQVFFPYTFVALRAFYVAVIALLVWLVLSVILSELKNREQEIAIENGDLD
jgi:hypothetical protein